MERVITGIVDLTIVPVTNVIAWCAENGVLMALFAALWVAFIAGIVASQGSLDAAWQWVRDLPLVLQAVVWLLCLPLVAGLWIWQTSWPFVVRLVLILGLAGWNVLVMIPRATQG